ncbi:hypothetical protein [Xanthomonas nasturtii]|uniref:Uncharacterized protein n=1 Tax=Xanthomonas nasturtii TaxID=1843581 RepID=A0ABT0LT23_9XANT|nr:hypothetical protein [Xanthomonas nasturtii]MCL1552495.1 hypothetical protein [Xanthomonas nasturtii]MCL1555467.1 hypothetical protein [Xanthomonas nasturtii]
MYNPAEALSIVGIYDPGIANLERVIFRANTQVNLASYLLFAAFKAQHGIGAVPLTDNSMWLGNSMAEQGDWVYIYTGPGTAQVNVVPTTPNRIISLYWGKNHTIFQASHLTVALVKIDTVQYPPMASQFTLGQQQTAYPLLNST